MTEEPLPGGAVAGAVRVGDTVRRAGGSAYVRAVLEWFESHDWAGAPRYLGTDELGREVLSYCAGHVPWESAVTSDESLARVAILMREFHDLTAGSALAAGGDVVCHNDLAPKNTVYRDAGAGLMPVAFIDWDLAAPGERIHDIAHVCWQYLDLGPGVGDIGQAARRMRLICDAYGLTDPNRLIETITWWQDRCWRGIEEQADAGVPAMIRLREGGAVTEVRAAYDWTVRHGAALEEQLG